MENRSRVGDIRRKFEGLNAFKEKKDELAKNSQQLQNDLHTKPGLTYKRSTSSVEIESQHSGSSNSGNKGNIKRSHAFRSDKQPRTFSGNSGKMVAVENTKITSLKPNTNNVAISEPSTTKSIENKRNEIGLTDPILFNNNCQQTELNVNLNSQQDFDKSIIKQQERLNISPTRPAKIPESATYNSVTQKTKVDTIPQPSYSIVLKPSNRALSKNVHKTNNSQSNLQKKTHAGLIATNLVNDERDNISTSNKSRHGIYNEIGGNSSNSSLTFNDVKSKFENSGTQKYNCTKLPEYNKKNSINEVLKSPLPQGPPPKKPPRTFAHNLKPTTNSDFEINSTQNTEINLCKAASNNFNIIHRPVRSKTESQIMLKKLELALLNHQQGVATSSKTNKEEKEVIKKSTNQSNGRPKNLKLGIRRNSLENSITAASDESGNSVSSGLCFRSLNCSGENAEHSNIYDIPFEPKSTFFVKKPVAPVQSEILVSTNVDCNRPTNKFDEKLYISKEHVYAEPCGKNRSKPELQKSFKTSFVKNGFDKSLIALHRKSGHVLPQPPSSQSNNGLHYMSTPILDKEKSREKLILDSVGRKHSGQCIAEAVNTNLQISNSQNDVNCSASYPSQFLDKQKIQMMVNEAYGKCLNLPVDGGSDSDSIASTPDEAVVKTVLDHETPISSEFILKEREREREQRTAERKGYLRRVCSRGKSFHRPASVSDVSSSCPNLFDYLLLVGLDLDPSRCKVPYIKAKYPPDVPVPNGIESLCFPDASDWPPQGCKDESTMGGCYCIVLTNSSGVRKYGYCRRVQPEGAAICLPLAYCIISPFKDNSFFNKILVELESHHGQSEQNLTNFIEELYKCPYPAPGQAVVVTQPSSGQRKEIVRRPLDQRQEEVDIARLLNLVRLSVFLQLFATLLLERKVALLSHSISKLSACVEGLQAVLFPFHWQHTLVPVVPSSMIDLCHAPTPYIIGLLKHKDSGIDSLSPLENVDQVLIVDVDECKVLRSMGDESSILPSRLSRGLRTALQLAMTECINTVTTNANLIASEALIRLFVELLGHYRDHIITSTETGKRDFQRENFVKSVNSSSKQHFLDWFTETAMFTAFIEERLDRNINPRGIFEQRCVEYLSDRSHPNFLKSYKGINKTVKTLGDRLKDWAALS